MTLLELVVVVVVLAILVAATVPQFSRTAARLRAEKTADQFARLMRYAHARAVAEGREVIWVWDLEDRVAYLSAVAADGEAGPLTERTARSDIADSALKIELSVDDQPATQVRFLPDGTAEAAELAVVHESRQYTVEVDADTGQVDFTSGPAAR